LNNPNSNDGGKGVPPVKEFPQGLRISNVKYYLSSRDEENNVFYYKSVYLIDLKFKISLNLI
jgi:hypothetical protein